MKTLHPSMLLCSATCLAALTGCADVETRPGHPLSYQGSAYYDLSTLWHSGEEHDFVPPHPNSPEAKQRKEKMETETQPARGPAFRSTGTPKAIWTARGAAWNKHVQYEAAAHKAQDVADALAIPLFGAAIATASTAMFHGSADAIAGAGLAGSGFGGISAYAHPEQDAKTDFAAVQGLLCVVDQTNVLPSMSVVPLIYDEAALRDAVSELQEKDGPLRQNPSTSTQALQKAVEDVIDSGNAMDKALRAAMSAYDGLPAAIYQAMDKIDLAAKTTGRTPDFSAISKAASSAGNSQATTQVANDKATTAAGAAGTPAPASVPPAAAASVKAVTQKGPSDRAPETTTLASTAKLDGIVLPATVPTTKEAQTDATMPTQLQTAQAKANELLTALGASDVNAMTRVVRITTIAQDDLWSSNFADIATAVAGCAN